MNRSYLLAAAAAVLVLVGLLVWKLSARDAIEPMSRAPIEAPVRPGENSNAITSATVDAPQRVDALEQVGEQRERTVRNPDGTTLRIHVRVEGLTRLPRNSHLVVVDSLGWEHETQAVGELDFIVPGLSAGAHMVELVADGIQSVREHLEIAPHSKEQDVEVFARPEQRLIVRWAGLGRSLTDELGALKIAGDRSVRLAVYATLQEPKQDGLPIDATAIARIERSFDLHARPDDTNLTGEVQPPLPSIRLPPDGRRPPLSPNDPVLAPDTFGVLNLAEPLPLFVSAWIDGYLLQAEPIASIGDDCAFATSFAGLPDTRTSLSLCLVDDETGAPIRSATIEGWTTTDWNEPLKLEDSGCLVNVETKSGWNDLVIEHPDHGGMLLHVMTLPGKQTNLGEVRLSKPRFVDVHVVDAAGVALAGVKVNAGSLDYFDASKRLLSIKDDVSTDADGNARVGYLGRGQYVIFGWTTDKFFAPRAIDTRNSTSVKIEMIARPAITIGIHVDPPPSPGTTVCITDKKSGLPAGVREIPRTGWTNALLAAGDYTVLLIEDGQASEGVELKVGTQPFIFEIAR